MSCVDIRVFITGGICVTVLSLYIIGLGYWNDTRIRPIIATTVQTSPEQKLKFKRNQTGGNYVGFSLRDDWNYRIQNLRKGCHRSDINNKYIVQNFEDNAIFFESKELNISGCKVPKAGSTLWTTVFSILTKRKSASNAFDMSRHAIHSASQKLYTVLRNKYDHLTTRAFVVSRDPYSRLFSAFIDKLFMCQRRKAKKFSKQFQTGPFVTRFGNCGYNVSFFDFLDKITTAVLKEKKVDRHWRPIYSLCRVCNVEYQYVIKQETLSRDLEYIINQLNINSDIKTTLTQMLHGAGANKTMKGVIKTMFYFTEKFNPNCGNKRAFFIRLWEGLKIQGYIRSNVAFPLSSFRTESSLNVDVFTKAVLTAMHTDPLSSTELMAQRRQALVKAYTGVSKRVISQIQEAYKMDFYLFGYDTSPPT